MEIFFGIAAIGIVLLLFFLFFGLIRYLIQNYFLYRIGQKTNLDIPVVSFIPFGSFYVAGQMWDGAVFPKGRFRGIHIGVVMVIVAVVIYFMGLSVGDVVISYLVLESIALFGVFNAYFKDNKIISGLMSVLNALLAGIPSIIILYLFNRELDRTMSRPLRTDLK